MKNSAKTVKATHNSSSIVYLNRFRGFYGTFLPIETVNFFVGENSTGKTSVLAALQLMTSPDFWVTGRVKSDITDIGSFRDVTRSEERFFQLGFISDKQGILCTFGQEKNAPYLQSVCLIENGTVRRLLRKKDSLLVSIEPPVDNDVRSNEALCRDVFARWANDPLAESGMHRMDASMFGPLPLTMLATMPGLLEAFEHSGKSPDKQRIHSFFGGELRAPLGMPVWIAPVRAKARRTYDSPSSEYSPEGEHLPFLLKQILDSKPDSMPRSTIREFGIASGLFRQLDLHRFGDEDWAPLEIMVGLEDGMAIPIYNTGYGVSQVLPVVGELVLRSPGALFLIQQPEVHLHPRAQASIGDIVYTLASRKRQRFVIETHSDYVIDRFRMRMRDTAYVPPRKGRTNESPRKSDTKGGGLESPRFSAQVVFFQRAAAKNSLVPLVLGANGDYPKSQPKEFRQFFLSEELRALGMSDVHRD